MAKATPSPSSSVRLAIVDTSVYVGLFRAGEFADFLLQCKYLIRASSVVLAELARGVRSPEEWTFVKELSERLRLVTPTEQDWLRSGKIVKDLSKKFSYNIHKTREIHFDVLISLSARRIGGAIITANREDFERIRQYVAFELIIPA